MAKLYGKCGQCRKNGFFIRKRVYKHYRVGIITSKDELCRICYNMVKKALDNEPKI